ncbi:unnamed protein product [Prunus brigantina]
MGILKFVTVAIVSLQYRVLQSQILFIFLLPLVHGQHLPFPLLLFIILVFGPPPLHPTIVWLAPVPNELARRPPPIPPLLHL